jgi:hypothetical protein
LFVEKEYFCRLFFVIESLIFSLVVQFGIVRSIMESASTDSLSYQVSRNLDEQESSSKVKELSDYSSFRSFADCTKSDEQSKAGDNDGERKMMKKVRAKSLMISSSLSLLPPEVNDILRDNEKEITARTEQHGKNHGKEHCLLSESTVIHLPFEKKGISKSRTKSFLQFHSNFPHSPTDYHPAFIHDPMEVIVATKMDSSPPSSVPVSTSSVNANASSFPFRRRHSRGHIDPPSLWLFNEE